MNNRAIPAAPVSKPALAALLACMLAGCAGAAPQTFDLTAPRDLGPQTLRSFVNVSEPEATLPTDSDRIVVRTSPEAVAYLSGAQWADRLPRLLQARLIESFENARLARQVGRPGRPSDFVLATDIRRFEVDVESHMAVVELSVKLVADGTGRVVAARLFSAAVPAPANGPPAMTAALNDALASVLRQIVGWTIRPY